MLYLPSTDGVMDDYYRPYYFAELLACSLLNLDADEFVRAKEYWRFGGSGSTTMEVYDKDRIEILAWSLFFNPEAKVV